MLLTGPFTDWGAAGIDRAVTIGVFDGVHRGHRFVFRQLASAAAGLGLHTTAVTFNRHPRVVLTPDDVPPLINTNEERITLLGDEDVDDVAVLKFNKALRNMTAEEFSEQVLAGALGTKLVVVGAGFRFGQGGKGDVDALISLGRRHGYAVRVAELLVEDERAVSSSQIRALISAGDLPAGERLLGRHFCRTGTVVAGDRRGAIVGFPTANLDIAAGLLVPGRGVYVAYAFVDGETLQAVVNIGTRPTFDGKRLTVEAHLLDFSGDLYGLELTLEFRRRLRSEMKFSGPDELGRQIGRDVDQARRFFSSAAASPR